MVHFSECSTVVENCNTETQIEKRDGTVEHFPGPGVQDGTGEDLPQGRAVLVHGGDVVLPGVAEEHLASCVVDGEGVRPTHSLRHEDFGPRAVHPGPANVRLGAPVGPEEVPGGGVDRDGPGLLESLGQDDPPVLPIQVGDLDGVAAFVAPVQVPADPIHGQPVGIPQHG